jgi:hypothetical protein
MINPFNQIEVEEDARESRTLREYPPKAVASRHFVLPSRKQLTIGATWIQVSVDPYEGNCAKGLKSGGVSQLNGETLLGALLEYRERCLLSMKRPIGYHADNDQARTR